MSFVYLYWNIKQGLWAVFKCIGEDAECIGQTWDRIFKEFSPSSEYIMLNDTDFEFYAEKSQGECFCEIWIPVMKK